MGIWAMMKNVFKGNDKPKNGTEAVSKTEEQEQVAVSLGNLVFSLDKAALALTKSSIDDKRKSKYAQMLIDMKREISGISEAKTIPALPEAMSRLFSEALPKAFEYGSVESVEEVKNVAFESIRVLLGTKKEQQTATLNLDIQIMACEIIEGEYWLSIRLRERDEAKRRWLDEPDSEIVENQYKSLSAKVKSLRERNSAVEQSIDKVRNVRRDIEGDVLSTSVLEVHMMTEEFLKTLPSAAEKIEAIEMIQEMKDRDLAQMRSENEMLARALGELDDGETVEEVKRRRAQKAAEKDTDAGESAQQEAVEQKVADADAQMGTAEE